MFKEYDKNTYKEKEVKDRTPFRTALKKVWNDVNVWRVLLFMVIVLIWFLGSSLKTNAAETNVYVDEEYLVSQFGSYGYYAIVNNGSGSYATIYSDSPIYHGGSTLYTFLEGGNFGYKMMKLENDYLVVDENGSSYKGSASSTIVFNTPQYLSSSFYIVSYTNVDMYGVSYGIGGTPSPGTEVKYSVANNIGAKPVEEPTTPTPDIIVSTDLTEVLTYLDEMLVCLKAIFSTLSIILFFLVAEWTANKVKNIVRRFSRYE